MVIEIVLALGFRVFWGVQDAELERGLGLWGFAFSFLGFRRSEGLQIGGHAAVVRFPLRLPKTSSATFGIPLSAASAYRVGLA